MTFDLTNLLSDARSSISPNSNRLKSPDNAMALLKYLRLNRIKKPDEVVRFGLALLDSPFSLVKNEEYDIREQVLISALDLSLLDLAENQYQILLSAFGIQDPIQIFSRVSSAPSSSSSSSSSSQKSAKKKRNDVNDESEQEEEQEERSKAIVSSHRLAQLSLMIREAKEDNNVVDVYQMLTKEYPAIAFYRKRLVQEK